MANYFEAPKPEESKNVSPAPRDGMIRLLGQTFHPSVALTYVGMGMLFQVGFHAYFTDSNRNAELIGPGMFAFGFAWWYLRSKKQKSAE